MILQPFPPAFSPVTPPSERGLRFHHWRRIVAVGQATTESCQMAHSGRPSEAVRPIPDEPVGFPADACGHIILRRPGLLYLAHHRAAFPTSYGGDGPAGRAASLLHCLMVETSASSRDMTRNRSVGVASRRVDLPTVARLAARISSLEFQLGDVPPECVDALGRVE